MKAIAKTRPGPGLEMIEVDTPSIGPREVLVQVQATSICGTDVHIYRWDPWAAGRIQPPLVIGHEFCGEIVAAGERVRPGEPTAGDYVSAESHIVCGVCQHCRTGQAHVCPNTRIIGVDRPGCFAPYVAIPVENAWKNPPEMPVEIACLQENFGNAVHTAFAVDVRARTVLITGCGPAGLMAIPVVKALGAKVVCATDVSPYRLELAHRMGADVVIHAREQDVIEEVQKAVRGKGVDVLLEMSGAVSAIRQGFELLKKGGEAAILGLTSGPFEFDLNNLVTMKGVTVRGIAGRRLWKTWYQMRALLASGVVDLGPIVTHTFPMSRWREAFETMASGQSGKVVMLPDAQA